MEPAERHRLRLHLGRFLAAIALEDPGAPVDGALAVDEAFVHGFTGAIVRQDFPAAEHWWAEANQGEGARPTEPLRTTLALLQRLAALAPKVNLNRSLAELPPEFSPPQYVS